MGIERRRHMGNKTKADIIFKDFWRVNERFADLFNTVIFKGKQVIQPEMLQEMDTDVSGVIEFKQYKETIARTRDVVKKSAYGIEFVVLGLESQKNIHYAMPLRTMLYDALGYLREYQDITRQRKNEKPSTQEEFLSKMRKEDRLHPIITIVIYYGETKWDGPCSLSDMMIEMPDEIKDIFVDYRMNLLQVRDSSQYIFQNEDVQTVFEISREIFEEQFDKIKEQYKDRDIKSELLTMIGKITDSKEMIKQGLEREVDVNMCQALEKLKNEGREEGREEGRLEGEKAGREAGKAEGKLEAAKVMVESGMDIDFVVEKLNLEKEILEKFMEEHK